MKPLIREFIYDKIRKSLYKHEFKRLIWNNPYFPFLTKEDYNSKLPGGAGTCMCTEAEFELTWEACNAEIKQRKILNTDDFNCYIENLYYNGTNNREVLMALVYEYNKGILEGIERQYGDENDLRSSVNPCKDYISE